MTSEILSTNVTVFEGLKQVAEGPLAQVAVHLHERAQDAAPILVFSDETGRVIDLDLRGTVQDVAERYAVTAAGSVADDSPKGRGRPRLGVVPREVTLLPRHWDWLAGQSGGASAALRRLVDEARKADAGRTQAKVAQERSYRLMTALAGDLPDYEAAVRALFAGDVEGLSRSMTSWPRDVGDYVLRLLAMGAEPVPKIDSPK